jgi:hypothetical protein
VALRGALVRGAWTEHAIRGAKRSGTRSRAQVLAPFRSAPRKALSRTRATRAHRTLDGV